MTKKQLLKITGNKYKNVNKDELIIIAMNKFIVLSVENFKLIPVDAKLYVKENKDTMKDELFKLYNVKSKNTLFNNNEREIFNAENIINEEYEEEEDDIESDNSKELFFNA
jgi:hypothetical protein